MIDVNTPKPSPGEEVTPPVTPRVDEPREPQKPPEGYVPKGALDEERELRKRKSEELEEAKAQLEEAQRKLEESQSSPSMVGEYSDEGKELKGEIGKLGDKLRSLEKERERERAEIEFPFLKDKKDEFDEFLKDEEVKRLSVRKAAQLFAAEKGLLDNPAPRVGLEPTTGGGHQAPEPKYSAEELHEMMKNDYKQYEKLVKSGFIEKLLK